MDVLAAAEPFADFWFEWLFRLDGAGGGLAFRLDDEGGGYFVALVAGSDVVELVKWLLVRDPFDDRRWFRVAELQRGRLPRPLARGEPVAFRLLVVGPYLECSFGDEVVLATLSAERRVGQVGLWVESGTLLADDLRLAPMRAPEHG